MAVRTQRRGGGSSGEERLSRSTQQYL
uniref:Uncharacterized protein n=1 Tax=Rhizophora mucronata TaxID=61149 RepID=A0A2P2N3N6_RHIMU